MGFVLVRIDDRLIHGQVTVAWGSWLAAERIALVNDGVATTDWKRDLYASTDALGAQISVITRAQFLDVLKKEKWDSERVILVVETPNDLLDLLNAGFEAPAANVGGMHFSEGKREILPYVFVSESDLEAMRKIIGLGIKLEARDVPQSKPVDLSALLATI